MIMTDTYKIKVLTMENRILTFNNVKSYVLKEGLITFIDSKTNKEKSFPTNNCEIDKEET